MEIRLLDKNDEERKLSFVLKGTNTTFANLLRRYIIEKVPTMAIEDVEINDNSSALYDEMLAHRLGLIPLTTDLKSYVPIYKCKCEGEGCNRCTLKLTLKSEGPGIVYASELKSKDPKVKPVFPKTPIVKLLKEQNVELIATAVLGQGNDHVKFSPGFAYYRHKPDVKIIKQIKDAEEFVKNCPVQGFFEMKGNSLTVNQDLLLKSDIIEDYIEKQGVSDAIKLEDTEDVLFYVESWGQLSTKEMVVTAMDEYMDDLTEFEGLLKK